MRIAATVLAALAALGLGGCMRVRPQQRERLAGPAMQFDMNAASDSQRDSVLEITEGTSFPSAGPGTAGAGCGCN